MYSCDIGFFFSPARTKRMQQLQTQKDVPLCQDTSSKFLSSTSRGEGETCATTRHARNYICLKWRWENMPCDERACESLIERPRSRLILQQQFYT